MSLNNIGEASSSDAVEKALCQALDRHRLSQNISQIKLAEMAGVSRRTLTRLAAGEGVSLDTFIRVMQALGLGAELAALIPDASISPVERVRFDGAQRQRARQRKKTTRDWQWDSSTNDSESND